MEDFNLDAPKTKDYVNLVNSLKIKENKSLLVLTETNKNIYLSSRNLKDSKVITVSDLTTYDFMNCSKIVFVESSVDVLHKMYEN